jgi:hypothetical protein
MKGVPANLPTWAYILHIAETYHIPPWQVERECTEEWWHYMNLWSSAKAKARKDG